MSRSERWQKFYRIYCKFSGILVALVGLLVLIGSTAWGMQHPGLHNAAMNLSFSLYVATVTGADFLLWLISLGVWISRRQSTTLWAVLGWGAAMMAAKFLNFTFFYALSGGAV